MRFKNNHNHLVLKVTELPLLKSITDNNVKIKFDNGFGKFNFTFIVSNITIIIVGFLVSHINI